VTQLESKLEQVQKQKSVVSSSLPAISMTAERISDPSVEDLKRTISDLSKEVGRLRLLQEQRIQTSKETATPTSSSAPPEQRAAPAMHRPSSEGVTLQLDKTAELAGPLNCYVYLVMDVELNIGSGQLISVIF